MEFDYKNILIMGYANSGKSVEKIIKKLNVDYKIFDRDHKINGGHYYSKLNRKIISDFDLVVISPGVSIYNKYVVMAERMGIKVIGELEFGYWFTDSPVIAITGTNGKTTTTSLINNIVNTSYHSDAFGNIGKPLSLAHDKSLDYLVCEVSSFQLESTYSFKPYISVILNIAEDHIDRHKTFENYIKCKLGLLKNCNEKSIVVLNADDELLMSRTEGIKAKKYFVSKYKKVKGVYISKGVVYCNVGTTQEIMSLDDLAMFGGALEDVLVSILVAKLLKIETEKIVQEIMSYEKFPHRMSKFLAKNGVEYIDDSKSTNVHSTVNALNSTENNIILLLGGEDKKLKFDEIFLKFRDKVKFVIAFGSARKKILASAKKCGFESIDSAKSLYLATKKAYDMAESSDTVLLSPACTSFDEFKSYSERGEKFVEYIKDLVNAKSQN